ncbi:hypothetical protein ACFR9U_17155 [Halorientalis brevis]|uniref:Uncharacterized protein n=1 Tax=Halorientalis brevis TaxID=1126241 RepID=A0ABD6CHB7_9EURY|nr:hypothetical protein [Halorientalis brevis]
MVSNPFDKVREAGAERLAGRITPSEIPHVQVGTNIAAGIEHEQAQALNQALRAAGMEDKTLHHDQQARQRLLLGVADAISNQNFRGWWFEEVAPRWFDNAEQAEQLVGLDGEEWRERIRAWHAEAHGRGLVETPLSDAGPADLAETAANVAENRFGVPLSVLVSRVINWDQGAETRRLLAGNIDHHNRLIRQLAEHIKRLQERIEQQNERIQELENQA